MQPVYLYTNGLVPQLGSFFPTTITDGNSLTDFLFSAAEGADDSAAKFTSLARARDPRLGTNFPDHRSW